MSKKDDPNIFEQAKGMLEKKKKKKKKKKSTPSLGIPKKREETTVITADKEMNTLIKKIREMDQDLNSRMEKVCDLSGMSKKEVERYIENPSNFTQYQWNKIQQEKKELEERLFQEMGIKAKKTILSKKKKKISKERKGKTLGGRKGWIPM